MALILLVYTKNLEKLIHHHQIRLLHLDDNRTFFIVSPSLISKLLKSD